MQELITSLPRLDAQNILHLLQPQLTQRPNAPHLPHHVLCVLRGHAGQRAQQLLRGAVHPRPGVRVLLRADRDRARGVRLGHVVLEVGEHVRGREGRGGPEDAQAREGQGEEDELGLDGGDGVRAVVGAGGAGLLLGRVLAGGFGVGLHVGDGLRGA